MALTVKYATPVGAEAPKGIRTGSIALKVNGQEHIVQRQEGDLYTASVKLSEGDEVSVNVSAEGLPDASGHTSVPARPQILDYSFEQVQVDTINATAVHLTLDHAPLEQEFYGIQIVNYNEITYLDQSSNILVSWLTPGYVLSMDETMQFDLEDFQQVNYYDFHLGGSTQWQPLTLVTRKQFEENVYDFYINSYDSSILDRIRENMPDGETGVAGGGIVSGEVGPVSGGGGWSPDQIPVKMQNHYYILFYRLSTEFYYYAKALFQSNFDFLSNMGLTPANFTWTNVSGGLGMVGAISGTQVGPITVDAPLPIPSVEP